MLGLIFLEPGGEERLLIVESISVVRAIDHLVAVLFTQHFASKHSDLSNFVRVLRVPSLVHESSWVVSRDLLNSFLSEEILSIIVILGLSLTLLAYLVGGLFLLELGLSVFLIRRPVIRDVTVSSVTLFGTVFPVLGSLHSS